MKTVEQASLENSKAHYLMAFSDELHKDADMDFRKGIEFAQQWISVEDELPPIEKWVICKQEEVYDSYFFNNQYQMESCIKRFYITHWRPIDRK